jgi:histidine decarboxylase
MPVIMMVLLIINKNRGKIMIRRTTKSELMDRTAISPYDKYCDGYSRPGSKGNGYVSVLKVSVGQVEKTDDSLLDGIVAYDRAEANDAYIGQINMETASSFCGIAGQVWGYDLAIADDLKSEKPELSVEQYDGSTLPVYDAKPLLEAGEALFGTEKNRIYPPVPGGHVICANKSITAYRPNDTTPQDTSQNIAFGVWCFIAIAITKDRENSADLFIEDAGLWTQDDNPDNLEAFLKKHRKNVAESIVACGKDQSVLYDRIFVGYNYLIMDKGNVGTALTCAPYITLAKNAIPDEGFEKLNSITLSEWKSLQSNK